MPPRVFLCCLCDRRDESSIEFAMMLLSLPCRLANRDIQVHFTESLEAGLRTFWDKGPGDDDVFVAMDTMMSGEEFVISAAVAPGSAKYVLGVHPIPYIEWDRVAAKQSPYVTNHQHLIDTDPAKRGYIPLQGPPPPDARAFWVKGSVLRSLGHHRVWEWAGGVLVDTKNQLSMLGKHVFTGCIGHRVTLR